MAYRANVYGEQYYIRYRKPTSNEGEARLRQRISALPADYGLIVHYLEDLEQLETESLTYRMLEDMIDVVKGNIEPCRKMRNK